MKVDYYLPPSDVSQALPTARRAKDLGFDGFFTAETAHDPFLPIGAAACQVTGLDWGTAIAVAFARSPMVTAMTARDLADVTEGRFMLGLGTQVKAHITRRFSMEWGSPGPRIREYVQALRSVWDCWQSGEKLDFQGDFYSLRLMTPFFDPGPSPYGSIPVYLAGVGPYLSRVAGEVGDGFHVHPFHTVDYLDLVVLPNIAEGAARVGRTVDDIEVVSTVFIVTGNDPEERARARATVAQQIAFYASTPSYAPILDAHGWDFGGRLNAMSKRGEWQQMADVITDEVLEAVAIVAPFEEIGPRIRDRYGNRIQRVGFYSLGDDIADEALAALIASTKG